MNILITGSTGFIGRHLIESFLANGFKIFVSSNKTNILDTRIIKHTFSINKIDRDIDFFKKNSIEGVIHLATCYIKNHHSEDLDDLISTNILFSTHILESACLGGVKWFLNTGTYWQQVSKNLKKPLNLYTATKESFELISKLYTDRINFFSIQLPDTYGSKDTRKKILNLLIETSIKQTTFKATSGFQKINLLNIKDICNAYLHLINMIKSNQIKSGESFNVLSDQFVSIRELADIIIKISKKPLSINWDIKDKSGIYDFSNIEFNKLPNWEQEIKLDEGITKIYNEKAHNFNRDTNF